MQDLKLAGLGVLILAVVLLLWMVSGIIEKDFRCLENVEDRPCLEGTVESNGGGTCECKTIVGDLKWELGKGCDQD